MTTMLSRTAVLMAGVACAGLLAPLPLHAAQPAKLTLKDHKFTPDTLTVPAGTRIRLEVTNQDGTPAEFESSDLRVEKIVVAGGTISVFIGPLKPGTYSFFDDYHPESAKGSLTAVEKKG
ncbi:MAG TPA: cupredoxin domain-containing protein [Rhodopila sp.]|nr:cupredoxin domain-containing protein [Rhodopila sp.]